MAQRNPGVSFAGCWEFPGGKIRPGETLDHCLQRELDEELGIDILPRRFLFRVFHAYNEKDVWLNFVLCDWLRRKPVTRECFAFRWVEIRHLCRYGLLPGDEAVLSELVSKRMFYFNRSTPISIES